jgi:hypothetical protein
MIHKNRNGIFIGALSLLVMGGGSPVLRAQAAPAGWVSYTDAQSGISLMYPADWKKTDVRGLVALQNPAGSSPRMSVGLSKDTGYSAADLLEEDEPKRYTRSKFKVAGKEGWLREGSSSEQPDWKRLDLFWDENENIFSVTCFATSAEAWSKNKAICMQILSTVKRQR